MGGQKGFCIYSYSNKNTFLAIFPYFLKKLHFFL